MLNNIVASVEEENKVNLYFNESDLAKLGLEPNSTQDSEDIGNEDIAKDKLNSKSAAISKDGDDHVLYAFHVRFSSGGTYPRNSLFG
jgi:hypothetical protein